MSELLRTENVSKIFQDGDGNDLTVLQSISFPIQKGQTIAIVGDSGTGKSVFLNLLGGMDKPSRGEIFFQNQPLSGFDSNKKAEWRNRSLGFIFQFSPVLKDLTALQNVSLPCFIQGESSKTANQKAKEALKAVQLEERMNFQAGKLSGGEQQRLAIARALINNPVLILADEPTGNLDPENGEKVVDLMLKQTKNSGAALVIVTHNLALVQGRFEIWELKNKQLHKR